MRRSADKDSEKAVWTQRASGQIMSVTMALLTALAASPGYAQGESAPDDPAPPVSEPVAIAPAATTPVAAEPAATEQETTPFSARQPEVTESTKTAPVAAGPMGTPSPAPANPAASPANPAFVSNGAPDLAAPLTLDQSILLALRNHGDVGAAEQNFVSAREGITSARSGYFPDVSATANYNYQQSTGGQRATTIGGVVVPITTRSTSVTTTGVVISQNIFDSGRTRAQVRGARARTLSAVGGFGSARGNLAYEVAANFFEQLRQEKLVAQREGQVQLATQQLEQIQAQIEEGVAARVDAQGIQVNLSQARFDLATARNDLAVAQTNFRNSLGLDRGPALSLRDSELAQEEAPTLAPATATPPVPTEDLLAGNAVKPLPFPTITSTTVPIVPELKRLDEYLTEARNLRPDLVQARAAIQQSESSLDLAKIELRPQITASAGYNIDPRSTTDRGFVFGAGISIPIFNAGGRKADVKAAEADVTANNIRLQQLTKDVEADVQAAFVDINGSVERIRNARDLVIAARTNLATATERYQLGLGIVLDIVNAQTQLFSAQTSATQAIYDYELALANLDRSVGRFAWANPGQVAPERAPVTVAPELAVTRVTKK